jgi:hypothetical protein
LAVCFKETIFYSEAKLEARLAANPLVLDQPLYEQELPVLRGDIRIAALGYSLLYTQQSGDLLGAETLQSYVLRLQRVYGLYSIHCINRYGLVEVGLVLLLIICDLGHCFVPFYWEHALAQMLVV